MHVQRGDTSGSDDALLDATEAARPGVMFASRFVPRRRQQNAKAENRARRRPLIISYVRRTLATAPTRRWLIV